jgi:CubicO group peptidase (beta-lactamase class C family)
LRAVLPVAGLVLGTGAAQPSAAVAAPIMIVFPRCDQGTDAELKSIVDNAAVSFANQGSTGWAITATRRIGSSVCSKSRSGGFARSGIDTQMAFTEDTVQPIGSVSKVITAAVVLDVLAQHQPAIPVTAKIGPYLPSWWFRAPGVDDITFQDLLLHRSGLPANATGTDTGSLRLLLSMGCLGTTCGSAAKETYNNSGYALLQLLAASVAKPTEFNALTPLFVSGYVDEAQYAGEFLELWVKDNFFAGPADASKASCVYDADTMAWTYPPSAQQWTPGTHPGVGQPYAADGHPGCGTGRWNFSSKNLASVVERLNSGLSIPKVLSDSMKSNVYGWDDASATTANDPYVTKGGVLNWGADADPGYRARIYVFPKGTAVAVVKNGNTPLGATVPTAWDARSPK